VIQTPRSTARLSSVSRDLEHAGLCEQAAPRAAGRQGYSPHRRALHTGYAIVTRETLVEERKVGVDDFTRRPVGSQQFRDEQPRLLQRRLP